MSLTDENAFGLFLDLFEIEDLEYGSESEEFVGRFTRFRGLAVQYALENPLGPGAKLVDLGHALYFEIGDGEHAHDPIAWLKGVCTPAVKDGFEVAAILTHGGRWVDEDAAGAMESVEGGYHAVRVGYPSEPLQRALYAAAFCHGTDGEDGWGPGLYVDTDAVEALGRQLKNAPTPLQAGGGTFYRLSLPR